MENEKIIIEQKAEIERLTDILNQYMNGELINAETMSEILSLKKQVDELTEENKRLSIKVWNYEKPARIPSYSNESMVNCNLLTCYKENADLRAENAELQKKMGKLNAENIELYKEHTALIAGSILAKQNIAKDTAKKIFEKIFEVLCCFTTQGKSKEYTEGFIDCLEEVDKRLQNLAKEKYDVEV